MFYQLLIKPMFSLLIVLSFVAVPAFSQEAKKDSPEATAEPKTAEDAKLWVEYTGTEGPGKGKRIVLISGDDEYRSEEAMPMLGQILSQRHGFDCTVLFPVNPTNGKIEPEHQTNIEGMHRIEGADLVVLGLRFRNLPDDQMKFFADYVDSGKPIIGFRTSTHAFNYPANSDSPYAHYSWRNSKWPGGFGQQVLGETWVAHHGHHGKESTRGVIETANAADPILKGVADVWGPTDVYTIKNLKESAKVLLRGQVLQGMNADDEPVAGPKNEPMMPLAWTQLFESKSGNKTRVFCTTMGAATDFANEDLRRLLVNACYWAVGMEDQIPERANVELVTEYNPTAFGFKNARKNIQPSDFELQK